MGHLFFEVPWFFVSYNRAVMNVWSTHGFESISFNQKRCRWSMLLLRNQLLPNDLLPLEYSSCRSGSHMALQFKPVSKKKTLETVFNTWFGTDYAYLIDERWETAASCQLVGESYFNLDWCVSVLYKTIHLCAHTRSKYTSVARRNKKAGN